VTAAQPVPKLRPAAPTDAPEILALIRELADYEHLLHEVDATREGLHAALFGPTPRPSRISMVMQRLTTSRLARSL
jgi:hypothetical protein